VNSLERAILRPFVVDGGVFETPTGGVAEEHAKSHDGSASSFENLGRADLANEQRAIAGWWRGLAGLSDVDSKQLIDDLHLKCREAIDGLLALAEKGDAPLLQLVLLANHILAGLFDLAATGRPQAARALMAGIGETVNNFEWLAIRKPELFREWARGQIAIPGLVSRKTDQARMNESLLKALQQGEDCPLAILPTGKRGKSWGFKGATLIAVRLVAHIHSSNNFYESDKGLAGGGSPDLPAWRHEAAKLDPFSKQSSRSWAEVAWQVLAAISPENQPERHPALKELFNVRQVRIDYPPPTGAKLKGPSVRRQSPSIAKHDMRETLFVAIKRIAPDGSRGTNRQSKEKRKSRTPGKGP
jgi:hypothetical protein